MDQPSKPERDDDDMSDHFDDEKVEGPVKQKMESLKLDDTEKEQTLRAFIVSQGDPDLANERYKVVPILSGFQRV